MKYIHVRNLEKYQPGYKDRDHIWAKIHYRMLVDPDSKELSEVSFSRLVKLIILETYLKKPILASEKYLSTLNFEFGLEGLEVTLKELSQFIEIIDVTEDMNVVYPREEKIREEKIREEKERAARFKKPSLEELTDALKTGDLEAASALVEAHKFLNYYESVGWVVGRSRKPMKNWRGAVATWISNRRDWGRDSGIGSNPLNLNKSQAKNMEVLSDFLKRKGAVKLPDLCPGNGDVVCDIPGN